MSTPEKDSQDHPSKDDPVPMFLYRDQKVLAGLVFLFLILLVGRWVYLSGIGLSPVEIDRASEIQLQYKIDINKASWIEWVQLEGLGETLARKIVDYREENGPFSEIDDLVKVNGIGEKTLAKFRPWLTLEKESGLPEAKAQGSQAGE